ncbi:hypothetical protein ACFWY6_41385 [Streptomyces sp. NPDC059037]|uniref:hypothetical protein n=1 Tax=Streptomyces sp. NPDC059037 TaxID=3346710 RepID=UPI00367DCC75
MTTDLVDAFERLTASLNRAYVDHRLLRLPNGKAQLVLGPSSRIVLQDLCRKAGSELLEGHTPSGDLSKELSGTAATEIAAIVEKDYAAR